RPLRRKQTRQLEQTRRSGRIIVSAMMNLTGALRETTATAATEMIVMRADHDDFFLGHRIAAVEHAHHVVRRHFFSYDVRHNSKRASEWLDRRLLFRRSKSLQISEADIGSNLRERLLRHDDD